MNKLTTLTLAVSATLAAPLLAQGASKFVPAANERLSGNSSVTMPFSYDAFRSQQVYLASEIATTNAAITSIAFRPDFETTTTLSVPNVTVTLSHTSSTPTTMSTDFATNLGANPVQVFSGTVTLPAQAAMPFGPMPFTVVIPFSTPFHYDTTQGNLLVDITAANPVPANRLRFGLDAALPGGTLETFGQSGSGITNLMFTAYGAGGNSLRPFLVPGGGVDITTSVATWMPDYAGAHVLALGTQTMPIDLGMLGAPGNFLYVDNIMVGLPHSWQTTFISKISISSLPIPNNPSLAGGEFYAQSVLLEPAANALGVVTTKALRLGIGDITWNATELVTSNDPSATQGSFHFGAAAFGSVVTQFGGTFN